MKNKKHSVEYFFLMTAISQFAQDLQKIHEIIKDKIFSEDEISEIIDNLVLVRKNIEALEIRYAGLN